MIFFTSYINEPHGAAKSALDFLKALSVICENVTLISPRSVELPDEIAGFKPVTPRWHGHDTPFKISYRSLVPGTSSQKQLFKKIVNKIQQSKINYNDTIIVNSWASKRNWDFVKHKFKGKKVLIVRESIRLSFKNEFGITKDKYLDYISGFDYLIFVSQIVMDGWMPLIEKIQVKSFYLPNCIEEEEVQRIAALNKSRLRKELGFSTKEFIIFYPGRIEYAKGHDILLRFFKKIEQIQKQIKFLIIGNAVGEAGKSMLDHLSKCKNITILSEKPSVLPYYYMSDILIFPSRAEAMPRTILEAMAFGMPIVASSVDGIPELIVDGYNGFLFDIDKPETMVEKIATMIKTPVLMKEFSERSKERYYTMFSRTKQIERLREIINTIETF